MRLRRGACPSLSAPMETGDGLLVRLSPADGRLSAGELAAIARAAGQFGNGVIEITSRGNVQIRGLTGKSAAAFAAKVRALGIANDEGLSVQVGPLAGLAADEIADPRPLAQAIRQRSVELGLLPRLGPKISVTVDGGGALHLGGIAADVKLEAVRSGGYEPASDISGSWLVGVGGTSANMRLLGRFDAAGAVALGVFVLQAVAEKGRSARARDLSNAELEALAGVHSVDITRARRSNQPPVGRFALVGDDWAMGFSLAYGQIESGSLSAFAAACGDREIRLAPGRGLLVLPHREDDAALTAMAERFGLVAHSNDPRLSIAACAGAPACASAHMATRRFAEALVGKRPDLLDGTFRLHVSGCPKGCARPRGPSVTVTGTSGGFELSSDDVSMPEELRPVLMELVEQHYWERQPA